jgi:hypothetical protein
LVNEDTGISKKKVAEKAKPVAFRKIEPIEVPPQQIANGRPLKPGICH